MGKVLAILGAVTFLVSLPLPVTLLLDSTVLGWQCALFVAVGIVNPGSLGSLLGLVWLNTANAAVLASPWLLTSARPWKWGLVYVNAVLAAMWWIRIVNDLLIGYWTWLASIVLLSFAFVATKLEGRGRFAVRGNRESVAESGPMIADDR